MSDEIEFAKHVDRLFVKPERVNEDFDINRALHAAVGFAGESGEILDAVKKTWIYNKSFDFENAIEEVGDSLFYLEAFAAECGFTLADARQHNIEKLRIRYPDGYTDQAAQIRADKIC